ncbi:MAG: threonylcarbamoyl-AMP synthase [Candidatus Eremiobacteraeota bacterium]|nr:threonylcarbamoyl-AMP synthase [Candidatus Eremiobacteraeota bacterium]
MPLSPATPEAIAKTVALLRNGGVVAFPTETVYGLGALVWDTRAVARIFELKARPEFDPLIVHVADRPMLERVAIKLPDSAQLLIERFWPGPLTLVLERQARVPELVTAGLATIAVRMPSHPVARAILRALGEPIAAPSANPFGYLSPTRAEHVAETLGQRVDLILDGGRAIHGLESTIVAFEPVPALLRPGAIPAESIEAVIGSLERRQPSQAVTAPGQLPVHYAPRTPLRIVEPAGVALEERRTAGALALRDAFDGYAATRRLSERGDLREAAAAFFDALHDLDGLGLERIDAQPLPERGLGLAMMDRLKRAAAR